MSKRDKLSVVAQKQVSSLEKTQTPEAETDERSKRDIIVDSKRMKNARLINIERIKPDPNQPRKDTACLL